MYWRPQLPSHGVCVHSLVTTVELPTLPCIWLHDIWRHSHRCYRLCCIMKDWVACCSYMEIIPYCSHPRTSPFNNMWFTDSRKSNIVEAYSAMHLTGLCCWGDCVGHRQLPQSYNNINNCGTYLYHRMEFTEN